MLQNTCDSLELICKKKHVITCDKHVTKRTRYVLQLISSRQKQVIKRSHRKFNKDNTFWNPINNTLQPEPQGPRFVLKTPHAIKH